MGNNADTDDDGDGVTDALDTFPLDASESVDTDGDGVGNNADTDDDNDGVEDASDAFPLDASETVDTDNDGIGNNADTDDDNDGIVDEDDVYPLDASESVDTDGDGVGNNADTDDDNDGVVDGSDAYPLDAATFGIRFEVQRIDTAGAAEVAVFAGSDVSPTAVSSIEAVLEFTEGVTFESVARTEATSTWSLPVVVMDESSTKIITYDDIRGQLTEEQAVLTLSLDLVDGNQRISTVSGYLNERPFAASPEFLLRMADDADGDFRPDIDDAFPLDPLEWLDTDNDGVGNNADTDDDGDGVEDASDTFPLDPAETLDTDNDGVGNNADTDDDDDGVEDASDAFPLDASESVDTDDGIGNNADTDDDNDFIIDSQDAYPEISIGDYEDSDGDGAPDARVETCLDTGMSADPDDDNDGVNDDEDYAPLDPDIQYAPIGVTGSGVKGPLINGQVTLYSIDGSMANLQGDIVGVGSTDERAQITGIEIPFPAEPPYLMRIQAVDGTTDLTTGKYPVITQHSTILTQTSFDLGGNFYATPLTSLATAMWSFNSRIAPLHH